MDRIVKEVAGGILELLKLLAALFCHQTLIKHHCSRFFDFLNELLVLCLQSINKIYDVKVGLRCTADIFLDGLIDLLADEACRELHVRFVDVQRGVVVERD